MTKREARALIKGWCEGCIAEFSTSAEGEAYERQQLADVLALFDALKKPPRAKKR